MDALTPVETYHFHIIKKIKHFRYHLYIADTWRPEKDIFIIGATMGLLCHTSNAAELYLSISRNPNLDSNLPCYAALKRDYLFYAQRDQRFPPIGINDLTKEVFLPAGTGFLVRKGEPVYFKVAAMNKSQRTIWYDILACLYYIEIVGTPYRPQPREEGEIIYTSSNTNKQTRTSRRVCKRNG